MKLSAIRAVFPDTIPVLTGYLFLGAGFGILLVESGYSVLWAAAMALLIFAGSGQYLLVGLLASGASLVSAAIATLLVNARHLFYGISLVDAYKTAGKRRFYMIFGLTDETYSLVTQAKIPEGISREDYCFWVTALNHCYWVCGCVLGAVVGTVVPIDFSGVSFVLTALFVTIFVEQWLSSKDHFPALVGVVCTALSLLGFGSEIFLIPAMAAIALILILRRHVGKEAAHE
ncbi:MAG: AzlC family ABC transporter permease [Oscillospiraceae bacterium]|nr:AzlC family ABC transporter permease [Oscillospiraceae bacterium]